jgi:hypothetical protein
MPNEGNRSGIEQPQAIEQYSFDKRFSRRRERWIAPGPTIRTEEFGVDVLRGPRERLARAFVLEHPYAGSMPATRVCVGRFRKRGVAPASLVGVAVFSVPAQPAAIPCYTGMPADDGVDLGRFVLLPEVAYNGETWFLARAMQALRAALPNVRGLTSSADPLELRDSHRTLLKPAHAGTIYQARRAIFCGRSRAAWVWVNHRGRVLSPRTLSKIRNEERGQEGARAQLIALGAPPRESLESPVQWLERILPLIATRVRHPGNFVYAFGLDRRAHGEILKRYAQPHHYPRLSKSDPPRVRLPRHPGTCSTAMPLHTDPITLQMLYE